MLYLPLSDWTWNIDLEICTWLYGLQNVGSLQAVVKGMHPEVL